MIVLGIDTSAYANAVGVVDGDRVLADIVVDARTDSLQKIILNIDEALKEAGLGLEKVEGLGIGLGPGSWTGIRVGVTVGKMLAFSTGKPACGVSTLDALAQQAVGAGGQICAVVGVGTGDAVYTGLYHTVGGWVERDGDYYVGDVPGLAGKMKGVGVVVGPEAESYQILGKTVIRGVARGSTIARLAARRLAQGQKDDALALAPLYLKESTARAFTSKYAGLER